MLKWSRNFSSSPVITTQRFHCRAPASVPGQGTKIHKLSSVAKKKKSSKSNCKRRWFWNSSQSSHDWQKDYKEEIQRQLQPLSHCNLMQMHKEQAALDQNQDRGSAESWALPMRVTGTPYSRAEMAVHFPVPFCPALSRIFGSRCLPSASWNLRILAVISIRNESSSVLFHSSKACVQDMKENNVRETRVIQETLP